MYVCMYVFMLPNPNPKQFIEAAKKPKKPNSLQLQSTLNINVRTD